MTLLTEQEAKERWCPYAHALFFAERKDKPDALLSENRDFAGRGHKTCCCLASGCMAWRWAEPSHELDEEREVVKTGVPSAMGGINTKPKGDEDDYAQEERVITYSRKNMARHGFCGLAGKPKEP